MEKKRRESTAGWVFESNEGQSNQQAEVTWRLLGRSLGMCLLLAAAPEFGGGGHLSDVAVIKQTPVALVQRETEKSV